MKEVFGALHENENVENNKEPLPMCLLVFSIVELRLTLDNRPRQNLVDSNFKYFNYSKTTRNQTK